MTYKNTLLAVSPSLIAAFLAAAPLEIAVAADLPPQDVAVNQRIDRAWEFRFAPYFVGANIVGTSQIGRLPATDLDVGTGDILENLHFGAMARAEALYRQKVGLIVDLAYMKLGDATDILSTGGRARVGVKQLIAEAMLTYRVHNTQQSSIDLYAGGRYWDITLDLNVTGSIAGSFTTERGDNWWDPVIGIRGAHRFNDKWSARGQADIGGFGVASDLTWNLQGGVGYHFNDTWSAHAQYKVLGVDYDNKKSGRSRFAYDTITHGPLLGIAARF